MSIVAHGMSRLNWVCRWSSGFAQRVKPAIHIFAGENVCIQVMMPMQWAYVGFLTDGIISPASYSTGLINDPYRNRRRLASNDGAVLRMVRYLA